MKDRVRYVEPVPIEDCMCTGLALVEDTGLGLRMVYYARQTCYENDETLLVIKNKVVVPYEGIVAGRKLICAFLDAHRPDVLHLVK